jgi:hypothetical protein
LPVEYQEVEYIESSWSQEIDTWLKITNAISVMAQTHLFYPTLPTDERDWLWTLDSNTWFWFWNNSWYPCIYSRQLGIACQQATKPQDQEIECFISSNNWWYHTMNWTTITTSTNTTLTWTENIVIFNNDMSESGRLISCRMFYLKIYINWTLERDLVPCYRKNDNVIWMYDLVGWWFYTNRRTWTFSKWWDILPYKKIRPLSGWEYILLSEWWTINKYNELTKSDNNTLITVFDNTTNWIVRCDQTDSGTTWYKVFNEEIIWFNILCQYTENYSYSWLYFRLQDDKWSSDVETWQRIEIHDDRDDYSWRYWVSIYNNWTKIYSTWSTTTNEIRIVWEKNWNDWTITVTWWPSFTYTFTNSAEMHRFSLWWWRWRTWTQWYYKEVIIKLK